MKMKAKKLIIKTIRREKEMMRKGIIGWKAMRIMALVCTTMNNKMNK